ncbi:MauE/DoxX family redox-associated membrane protein [Cellulomonas humilata]|uniref:Membrane protein YphA (DoxX/SURF4 family) n=1 Tax=Cellulomonas humilata TaxID=144055 RepID=A0ABU0EB81_9CELL|nr:MauE/DoxX family redox-associated membrane protein [Cellulomonas humilata]MDQ0372530.1 putative membrane protein YphA (DoxX/SURF4 family) [Cellulomonas humilata]
MLSADVKADIAVVLTVGLGLMWLWAGVAKLRHPLDPQRLRTLLPLPVPVLAVAAGALPIVELGLGVLLLTRTHVVVTAWFSALLLVTFAGVQVAALVRASLTPTGSSAAVQAVAGCGCFGRAAAPVDTVPVLAAPADLTRAGSHVARALVLAAVAVAITLPCPYCVG